MNVILEKGYARKVPSSQVTCQPGKKWYLPHHGVYHPQKPGKIRVVFECSTKFSETSLNNKLLRLRLNKFPRWGVFQISQRAYSFPRWHRVHVPSRSCSRTSSGLLAISLVAKWRSWASNQMNVHLFGAISLTSCANFAVRKAADDSQGEVCEETANVLRRNCYVDDCLRSEKNKEKATKKPIQPK